MQDMRDRSCANCGSREPTGFAIVYRDRARARICGRCRHGLDGLPTHPVNKVSEVMPTVAVVLAVSDDDIRIDPLFAIGWDLLGLLYPNIAQVFGVMRGD